MAVHKINKLAPFTNLRSDFELIKDHLTLSFTRAFLFHPHSLTDQSNLVLCFKSFFFLLLLFLNNNLIRKLDWNLFCLFVCFSLD